MVNKKSNKNNEIFISYGGKTIKAVVKILQNQKTITQGSCVTWQIIIPETNHVVLEFDERNYKTFIEVFKDTELDSSLDDITKIK